jgi:hypothetical protein
MRELVIAIVLESTYLVLNHDITREEFIRDFSIYQLVHESIFEV